MIIIIAVCRVAVAAVVVWVSVALAIVVKGVCRLAAAWYFCDCLLPPIVFYCAIGPSVLVCHRSRE